jgi:hypothetical protein
MVRKWSPAASKTACSSGARSGVAATREAVGLEEGGVAHDGDGIEGRMWIEFTDGAGR